MSGWPLPDGEEQLRVQIARLHEQLAEEQLLRRQAEEAVEAVAADRNRLQVSGAPRPAAPRQMGWYICHVGAECS